MPKQQPTDELEAIQRLIEGANQAMGIDAILTALVPRIPRRNLQRRLAHLVAAGRLVAEGRGRGTRYRPDSRIVSGRATANGRATAHAEGEARLSVSPAGDDIRALVARPVAERTPAGYVRAFLDEYRPNHTAYLPADVRARLHQAGAGIAAPVAAGTYNRRILDRLLIDLSWNSSRLEGNTYSLLETQRLLESGEAAEGKAAGETQMILNHKAAIEFIAEEGAEIGLDRRTVLNLHGLLSDNLLRDPAASGRLRAIGVGIDGSVYHPPEVPQLIDECFGRLLDTAAAIHDPFEQAFFLMVQLPYLQPFEDVNKRVSRLAANIPLLRHKLCPLSFVDVPNRDYVQGLLGVYELRRTVLLRDVFVWAYERSAARYSALRQSLGEPDPFNLRYRNLRIEAVGEAVRQGMNKKRAVAHIKALAQAHVPAADREKFVEIAEGELLALHEGNYSRYRIRPAEFDAWRRVWGP